MKTATIPIEEPQRLAELYHYEILDTPEENDFNEIVQLASQICKTPISAITLLDHSRQWVKASVGLKELSIDRSNSFCSYTILNDDLFEVRNTLADERFCNNPLVKEKPKMRFYAGMPLITSKGNKLGALCVIDTIARSLSDEQIFALKVLSKQVVKLIELRLLTKQAQNTLKAQEKIISVMSHDIRSPLTSIKAFLDLNEEEGFAEDEKNYMLTALNVSVSRTLQLLNNLVDWSKIQLLYKKRTETVNLHAVVKECIEQAELNIILKNNQALNKVNLDLIVNADKEGLMFILRNLISNANKFTENGFITISGFVKNNQKVFLCVEDTGVGIEMHKINQIFEGTGMHHTQGTQNEKGSGLGLSLIRNYLEKTGNEIQIKSKQHKGTSVCFSTSIKEDYSF